jgi:hypothetical protein
MIFFWDSQTWFWEGFLNSYPGTGSTSLSFCNGCVFLLVGMHGLSSTPLDGVLDNSSKWYGRCAPTLEGLIHEREIATFMNVCWKKIAKNIFNAANVFMKSCKYALTFFSRIYYDWWGIVTKEWWFVVYAFILLHYCFEILLDGEMQWCYNITFTLLHTWRLCCKDRTIKIFDLYENQTIGKGDNREVDHPIDAASG